MKPAAFKYHVATSTAEAADLLATLDGEVRVLAGGQSLVPLMNFRLAQPDHLIDLNRVQELAYVRRTNGAVAVGALARQSSVERSEEVRASVPLLAEALTFVAHPPIRHRGTVVGSLAHADPAAEMPAVALALDARITLRGAAGERSIPAHEFFLGPFETAVREGELVTEVSYPSAQTSTGFAFVEFVRRHGDFAIAGAAVTLTMAGDRVEDSRIALCGVGPRPLRAEAGEKCLRGEIATEELVVAAADAAVEGLEPSADIHGSSAYRVRVARVQVRKALTLAIDRAQHGGRA